MNNRITFAVVAALIACPLTTSCSKQEKAPEPAVSIAPHDTVTLSSSAKKRFNIEVATVGQKPFAETISTTGEIKADENRVFHLNSLANGRVIKDNVMLGDVIRAGETLGLVQNIDVARIYGDYIHQAHQNEIDIKLEETRLELNNKNYDRIKGLLTRASLQPRTTSKPKPTKSCQSKLLAG